MALWHLATLSKNRVLIESGKGIQPLISMLVADGDLVPCDGCSAHVRLVA